MKATPNELPAPLWSGRCDVRKQARRDRRREGEHAARKTWAVPLRFAGDAWLKARSPPTSCACSSSASSASARSARASTTTFATSIAEAKSNGYDKAKIMREIVKLRAMETHTRQERDAILETYRQALGLE
jgi:hypothetical protein